MFSNIEGLNAVTALSVHHKILLCESVVLSKNFLHQSEVYCRLGAT